MIDQLPIYLACFVIGWVPLKWVYYQMVSWIPFTLQKASTRMSYFPILYLVYLVAEFARAYFMMIIVHDWLEFDYDLLFGIALWLVAISWPPFVPKKYKTFPWLYLSAFYFYLFPFYVAIIPVVLVGLYFLGVPYYFRYIGLTLLFAILGLLAGGNSLYLLFYLLLVIFMITRQLVDSRPSQYS